MDQSLFVINGDSISIKDKTRKGSVIIDDSVEGLLNIDFHGFEGSQLESIDFSSSKIQVIKDYGFASMTNINQIIFPNTLHIISTYSFRSSAISKLVFPSSITKIDSYAAFEDCLNLNEISFSSPCEKYRTEDNCLISNSDNRLIRASANLEVFDLNVSIVSTSAFSYTKLRKFISTKNLTSFATFAFISATKLTSIDLTNSSIEILSSKCFQSCYSLNSIVFPTTVKSIENNIFCDCPKLKSVMYLGYLDFRIVKAFDSPSSIKVYVLSSYDYDRFCEAHVHRISYPDIHRFIIIGQITCNYRNANINYLLFHSFIFMLT